MQAPDYSNLNSTAAALSYTINTHNVVLGDAFGAIAAYLNNPAATPAYFGEKAGAADVATQKFNELVAALNRVAG